MTKTESFLKKSPLYPALILESFFSFKKRRFLIRSTKYLLLSVIIAIILGIIIDPQNIYHSSQTISFIIKKLLGLCSISFGVYLLMQMFEAYFASNFYFEHILKNKYESDELYTFSAGRILRKVKKDNLLIGLLNSYSIGRKIIYRLGITPEEADKLLKNQEEINDPPFCDFSHYQLVKVADLVSFVFDNFSDFRSLLVAHGLEKKDLLATTEWAVYSIESKEYHRRFWTKERLSRIPGFGTDWSFGKTYRLNKYSRDLLDDPEVNTDLINFSPRTRELSQIQSILARANGANVMLVGAPGQEKMEVIWNLCREIKNKTTIPNLIGRKPILFLTTIFSSTIDNQNSFEEKLTAVLSETLRAGNIILVIDNYPRLVIQAKQFGFNLNEIIEPYLASANDQVIALADTEYFHTLIETDQATMSHFEVVQTRPLTTEEITKIISHEALSFENTYEIFFTYPAIKEIARGAEYYFSTGVSADKARDLLAEISPWAIKRNTNTVGKEEVIEYLRQKTDIPIGTISTDEKEKLLNLENLLMQRVIAQREAVFAVAGAIRRNRAGIRNEKRPLGSFLFLGPTGVGKTETAKALADIIFDSTDGSNVKSNFLRLDMSEFQNSEALSRLIGSRAGNTQGILSNLLREHPYGVLLLDEFEKTDKDVLDLFLQIIDEGYFSDAFGRKVMAQNILFIATSNAGAEKIFELMTQNKDLKKHEDEIISHIVSQGILKPELINRFDATILFHPLSKENLIEIAKLMLQKVGERLSKKGISLKIDNELLLFVADGGYNQTFGARPMNRFIQDTIEEHLADLIIRGNLNPGQTVGFQILDKAKTKSSLRPVIV